MSNVSPQREAMRHLVHEGQPLCTGIAIDPTRQTIRLDSGTFLHVHGSLEDFQAGDHSAVAIVFSTRPSSVSQKWDAESEAFLRGCYLYLVELDPQSGHPYYAQALDVVRAEVAVLELKRFGSKEFFGAIA